MKVPNIYIANTINENQQLTNEKWIPAKCVNLEGFYIAQRFKLAWMVFTGKADLIVWSDKP